MLASEENEKPILVHHGPENANYAVIFDPLDGSSNIDVNVNVGTTFSIVRRPEGVSLNEPEKWVLQPGTKQIAAGYVVYGSSTILVYSVGEGVHGFTLDPAVGAFILSHPNMQMPNQGKYYSVNEAYADSFPPQYNELIRKLRSGELGHPYASWYIGSMVADFHRTLLKGGIFLYPPTQLISKESYGCCTRRTQLRSSPSRPVAWRMTAVDACWKSSRIASTNAYRS